MPSTITYHQECIPRLSLCRVSSRMLSQLRSQKPACQQTGTDSPIRRFSKINIKASLSHVFVPRLYNLCAWGLGRESRYLGEVMHGTEQRMTLGVCCSSSRWGATKLTTRFLVTSWLDWFHWVFVHQIMTHLSWSSYPNCSFRSWFTVLFLIGIRNAPLFLVGFGLGISLP